ncbi:MAG: hypothetical protein IKO93_07775 [Lentisphaeria bacterium]|nr:hypothetical protein [Lentisphaeria bacterium]
MKEKMFKKAANSFAGRMLRRLCGEETGTVMLEYIVIALLIIVVGVVVFTMLGGILSGTGQAVAEGVVGDEEAAEKTMDKVKEYTDAKKADSKTRVDNIHDRNKTQSKW